MVHPDQSGKRRKYNWALPNKTNKKKSNAEVLILQHSIFKIQPAFARASAGKYCLVLRHFNGGAAQLKIVVVNILT